jgi:TolB-like protein
VGVHLGDTIFEKGDIRGDGVNIASRLESMAVEGGVFVSKEVHDQLANQKEFEGVSLGLQSMKGVGRLIEVYGLKGDLLTEPKPGEYQDNKVDVHKDDEVPSIAIIPFENKGADEDMFYAYGISADLITDCSSSGLIRVAGLNDIEKLDYKNLKYDELSKNLFVRYISTGTLWKMGDMFQLSIELYDTKDKKVVWSDRWQENWDNLPTIKGSLSDGLLKALDTKPKVKEKIETTNPEAYEFYLKAKQKYAKRENTDDIEVVRGLLHKAIELDDNLIVAKDLV